MPISFLKNWGRKDSMGLDWGSRELKWVRLEKIPPKRYRLTFLDRLEFPKEARETVPLIREYVTKKNLEGIPVAVSLSNQELHIRRMELPSMPDEDLKEAIRWQMRDVAEGSIDDYQIQFAPLHEEAGTEMNKLTLLGFAVKQSLTEEYRTLIESCQLNPFFMEPAAVSLAFAISRVYAGIGEEWVGCADIRWGEATFLVIGKGKLHFVRPLTGIAYQEADQDREKFPGKCAMEIQRAIDNFSITYKVERIDHLFLAGEGAGVPHLPSSLSTNLGIPTEILNPLEGIEQVSAYSMAAEKPYLFGTAVGLGFLKP